MADALFPVLVFVANLGGCAALALSQHRHWRKVGAVPLSRPVIRGLRLAGYGLLAASLGFGQIRDSASFGVLLWITSLSASAVAVALTLACRPALRHHFAISPRHEAE